MFLIRLPVNWLVLMTAPVWAGFVLIGSVIRDLILHRNKFDGRSINRTFRYGTDWFWE